MSGIRYACRHCEIELGSIPFESVEDTIKILQKMDETEKDHYVTVDEKDGIMTVRCICEQCEQSLQRFPDFYSLKKWIQ